MTDRSRLDFLDLPLIIRSIIYEQLFLDETVNVFLRHNRPVPLPKIANTCRQLRTEVPPHYYRFARFNMPGKPEHEKVCGDVQTQTIFGMLRRLVLSLEALEYTGFDTKLLVWTTEARKASPYRNATDIVLEENSMACGCDYIYLRDSLNISEPISNGKLVLKLLQSAKVVNLDLLVRFSLSEECFKDSTELELSLRADSSVDFQLTKWTVNESGHTEDFHCFLDDVGIDFDGELFQKQLTALVKDGEPIS